MASMSPLTSSASSSLPLRGHFFFLLVVHIGNDVSGGWVSCALKMPVLSMPLPLPSVFAFGVSFVLVRLLLHCGH